MSEETGPFLEEVPQSSHDYAELGHKLTDKKNLRDIITKVNNPPGMSTMDVVVLGLIKDEFAGTGFDKDFEKWRVWLRDNNMADDGWRAKQLENVASAAAQKEQERKQFRDKLLGSLER